MAKLIHIGLTHANLTSWSYWTAMAQSKWSQKNRFELLRLNALGDDGYESYGDLKKGGTVTATPNLWALGNYSRFIRPGFVRIDLTGGADDIDALMGTAWLSPDAKRAVVVFVNNGTIAKGVRFTTDDLGASITTVSKYVTDATHALSLDTTLPEAFSPDTRIVIPQRAVAHWCLIWMPPTVSPQPRTDRPRTRGSTASMALRWPTPQTISHQAYISPTERNSSKTMTMRAFILYTGLLLVNTSVAMLPAAHTTDTRQLTYHIETQRPSKRYATSEPLMPGACSMWGYGPMNSNHR
jgi:hypothetical protein